MRYLVVLTVLLTPACQAISPSRGISHQPLVNRPEQPNNLDLALCALGAAGLGLAYRSLRRGLLG